MYRAAREFEAPDVPPQLLLDVVYAVGAYPEFLKSVRRVRVLQDSGECLQAEFQAGLVGMEFTYILECRRSPQRVHWKRIRGAFRALEGNMTHIGGTRFRYENSLEPGFAVPEIAVRFVLERSLPRLIKAFCARATELSTPDRPPLPSGP